MAATVHPARNDAGPSLYPRVLIDNRYPSPPQRASSMIFGAHDQSTWDNPEPSRRTYQPSSNVGASVWTSTHEYPQSRATPDLQSQSQEPQRNTLSYALPPGAARRVVERYSLDDNEQRAPSRSSTDTRATAVNPLNDDTPESLHTKLPEERATSPVLSTTPRHLGLPATGVGTSNLTVNGASPPIMPLSASPSYSPPIASKHRAFPQQPTYVTPPTTPVPINTVFSPRPPPAPQEEICVECAMRDQDMADVDVMSPGVWDRESDAAFEDLKRRELEDEANGVLTIEDSTRPRAKGGRLTEVNLRLWLSIVSRSPISA
jgi:hypothetical protein